MAFAVAGVPLLSSFMCFLIGRKFSWVAPLLGTTLLFISFIVSIILFYRLYSGDAFSYSVEWFSVGSQKINIGFLLDRNSLMMLLVVMLVSWVVHVFSIGYMAEDEAQPRYFALLGFFTFAMAGLVMSNNLLLTFCFWELVGFSSYRLIGHWHKKLAAAKASTKAFLINRVGDLGFFAGLMILWSFSNSLDIISFDLSNIPAQWLTAAGICIFLGIIGKSAQFPLFNWLPDAMEGPTPVSALIHAATMVAAGVYLLVRMYFIFTPDAQIVIACIGMITAILGALGALFQYDIKKVLAYSTISQLGFMVMAIGAGAMQGGFLHLLHHALFKAGLFLGAGAIIHAFHHIHTSERSFDVQDIRNLGGVRKSLPVTCWCFIIFSAALAGLPLTSGFVSKEMILTQMSLSAGDAFTWRWIVLTGAWVVTLLTPLYIFRLVWFVFFGKPRHEVQVSEVPLIMRIPLVVLAIGSLSFMISFKPFHISTWISTQLPYISSLAITLISILTVGVSIGIAFFIFRNSTFRSIPKIIALQFYLDLLSEKIVWSTGKISSVTTFIDRRIDSLVHAFAYLNVTLAHVTAWSDRYIVDGLISGVAYSARGVGQLTRSIANGKIQSYFLWALASLLIFILWILY